MYDWDMHDRGWSGWLGMSLMMAVLFALVVALVVLVVRDATRSEQPVTSPAQRTPRDTMSDSGEAHRLLDERFARGDIDERDYVVKRALLDAKH